MNWLKDVDAIEEGVQNLSEQSIKATLERIVKDCEDSGKFDLRYYTTLVELIPYIHLISSEKREFLMKSLSGRVLEQLDNFDDEEEMNTMEERHIPSLFELKNVIVSIWNKGYESQYMIKCIDNVIFKLLKSYNKDKFKYISMFFSNLQYPYTKENLKKCKTKIIKENHPDNGGSGEHIQMIQSIYKVFLNYIC